MKKLIIATKYILLAIAAASFTSCERDANNIDLPTIEPQLVVQGVISPQNTETRIYVSLTKPVFSRSNNVEWITDATVKISDGTNTVQLQPVFSSSKSYFVADSSTLKIIEGKTYTLWVNTATGRAAKAECVVPYSSNTASLVYKWDTTSSYNSSIDAIERRIRLNMEWNDVAGGENYYRAGADVITYSVADPTKEYNEQMYNNTLSDLLTDKGKDGQLLARRDLDGLVTEYLGSVVYDFSFRPKGIRLYLLNCDINYYKFHESADRNSNGDPFSEPTLIYSNINGGVGYFGACSQYIKEIMF